jgi:hypothetical protein
VHATGEPEHADLGHSAAAAFVPASQKHILRAAMQVIKGCTLPRIFAPILRLPDVHKLFRNLPTYYGCFLPITRISRLLDNGGYVKTYVIDVNTCHTPEEGGQTG